MQRTSFRAIYDLAILYRSRFIIATDQSENPLSKHYSDLSERRLDWHYRRFDFSPAALVERSDGRLTLQPRDWKSGGRLNFPVQRVENAGALAILGERSPCPLPSTISGRPLMR
ncbi:MAG: penicillin acylase family protein [Pseudomonadota bacterium]|nr:penicillin acylase family protein [Pseudomonadota bacterium]